ncbi:MAG: putative pterin-4-alpha-carbinolamine dehydratase [Candidatus Thorarchaeota archaeon]|nr:MAG: putative pterin-4-alpha-carbinolamine dehydratase [Candidatus Thorarchaeota archaeon]
MTSREDLLGMKCVPCEGGIPPLEESKISEMMDAVSGWEHDKQGPDQIKKTYKFEDFKEAMNFVNKVADLAEEQGHHPDIAIHWNEVTLTLWTHAIDGLHDNDFVMAAKIDELAE